MNNEEFTILSFFLAAIFSGIVLYSLSTVSTFRKIIAVYAIFKLIIIIIYFGEVSDSFGFYQDNARYYNGFAALLNSDIGITAFPQIITTLQRATFSTNNGFTMIYFYYVIAKMIHLDSSYYNFSLIAYLITYSLELIISYYLYLTAKMLFTKRIGIIAVAIYLTYPDRFIQSLIPLKEVFTTSLLAPIFYYILLNATKTHKNTVIQHTMLITLNIFNRIIAYIMYIGSIAVITGRFKDSRSRIVLSVITITLFVALAVTQRNIIYSINQSTIYWLDNIRNEQNYLKSLLLIPFNIIRYFLVPYPSTILNMPYESNYLILFVFPASIKYAYLVVFINYMIYKYKYWRQEENIKNSLYVYVLLMLTIILAVIPDDIRFTQTLLFIISILIAHSFILMKKRVILLISILGMSSIYYFQLLIL